MSPKSSKLFQRILMNLRAFAPVILFASLLSTPPAHTEDLMGLLLEGNPQAEELLKWAELSAKDQAFFDCYVPCLKSDPNLVPIDFVSCQSTAAGTRQSCKDLKKDPMTRLRLACAQSCSTIN